MRTNYSMQCHYFLSLLYVYSKLSNIVSQSGLVLSLICVACTVFVSAFVCRVIHADCTVEHTYPSCPWPVCLIPFVQPIIQLLHILLQYFFQVCHCCNLALHKQKCLHLPCGQQHTYKRRQGTALPDSLLSLILWESIEVLQSFWKRDCLQSNEAKSAKRITWDCSGNSQKHQTFPRRGEAINKISLSCVLCRNTTRMVNKDQIRCHEIRHIGNLWLRPLLCS